METFVGPLRPAFAGNVHGDGSRAGQAVNAQLPGGGRRLFPQHRVVAYYGAPQNVELGALGIGTPAQASKKLLAQMRLPGSPERLFKRRGGQHSLCDAVQLHTASIADASLDGTRKQYLADMATVPLLIVDDLGNRYHVISASWQPLGYTCRVQILEN